MCFSTGPTREVEISLHFSCYSQVGYEVSRSITGCVIIFYYYWWVIGRVGCDRPKKEREKNTKQTQNSSENAINARIWQIRVLFALRDGRVRFGADLFNRTDRCTFSPSSSAAAASAAQQKNDKSP